MLNDIAGAARARILSFPEFRLGLGAWAAFFFATCAYCVLHQALVSAVTPDLRLTFSMALREWSAWALLAPWALKAFREPAAWRRSLLRCVLLALVAASLPVIADQLTQERSVGASLLVYWTRNLVMAVVLLFIARALAKRSTSVQQESSAPSRHRPRTLLVCKGEEVLLDDVGRIRDVIVGPDGLPYIALNQPNGQIYRLVPE